MRGDPRPDVPTPAWCGVEGEVSKLSGRPVEKPPISAYCPHPTNESLMGPHHEWLHKRIEGMNGEIDDLAGKLAQAQQLVREATPILSLRVTGTPGERGARIGDANGWLDRARILLLAKKETSA